MLNHPHLKIMPRPYRFSRKSLLKLETLHPDLRLLCMEAIKLVDFTVLEGHRSAARQQEVYDQGASKARPGYSLHNRWPSEAVDLAPYPVDWQNRERFTFLAGVIVGIGQARGIGVRWGGDWAMNGDLASNQFDDLVHFELVGAAPAGTQRTV